MRKKTNMLTAELACIVLVIFMTVPRVFGAWSADIPLTFGPTPAWYPSIFCDPFNRWNVVFQDTRSGPVFYNTTYRRDIFYKRYNGTNYTPDVQVSMQDYFNGATPDIVCTSNNIYVAWADEGSRVNMWDTSIDTYFSKSADGGLTWSVPVDVSGWVYRDDQAASCISPKIAVSPVNGKICIIWENPTTYSSWERDIKAAISSDNGQTWSSVLLTSASAQTNGNTPVFEYPSVKADNKGNFFAVWDECVNLGYMQTATWLRYSRYNGSWSPQTTLVGYDASPPDPFTPSISIWMPDIAVKDTNHLYVVFTGDLSGPARQRHVYFMCSTNGTVSWTTPVMVSTVGQESDVPKILYDSSIGGVRVVYEENKHYAGPNKMRLSDVVMATSTDNGKTWTYLTLATGFYEGDPRIAENKSGGLAVTWEDNRTGDWRIYMKIGP